MKKIIYSAFALTLCLGAFAQDKPGVGINQKKVDKSAVLDVAAKNKGVLIPRVTLNDIKTFGLEGESKTESMLVFNASGTAAKGFYYWTNISATEGKWELITSESVLNKKIEDLRTEINTKIDNLTKIGDPADLSYLVAFKPDGVDSNTGSFSYLVPRTDGSGLYDQKSITLKDLVLAAETKTYINVEKHDIPNPEYAKDNTKPQTINVVKAYWYYNEEAVNAWLKVAGNDIKDVLDPVKGIGFDDKKAGVFKIDVIDAVSSNWSSLFEKNKEFIKEFLKTTPGNVFVKETIVDGKTVVEMYYVDKDGKEQVLDINALETKTRITKGSVGADGKVADYKEAVEGTLVDGQVIFRYAGEEKGKFDYLNITEEVRTALTHETVKKELTKYLSTGGTVYYGEMVTGDGKNVLYKLEADGVTKTLIDISENIIKEINTNESIIELIKEKTKVIVETGTNVPTGEVINGYTVYKATAVFKVNNLIDGYDSELAQNTFITTKPMKYVIDDKTKKGAWVENKADKFGRLVKASILDLNGQVVLSTVTDVKILGDNEFTFAFGVGNSYYPLINAQYEIIFEYLGATKQ